MLDHTAVTCKRTVSHAEENNKFRHAELKISMYVINVYNILNIICLHICNFLLRLSSVVHVFW
jgi:hypothetical protein